MSEKGGTIHLGEESVLPFEAQAECSAVIQGAAYYTSYYCNLNAGHQSDHSSRFQNGKCITWFNSEKKGSI